MTPNSMFIVFYWSLLFLLLIGQGVLLLTVRNSESLAMLTSGVGLRLVAINLIVSSTACCPVVVDQAPGGGGRAVLTGLHVCASCDGGCR